MEVLLVRAAVPFPCPRRSQKSAEGSESQKARPSSSSQSKFLTSDRRTESPTKSIPSSTNLSVDPQTSPMTTVVPLPGFPLKFRWFKGSKKDVCADVSSEGTSMAAVCKDVASIALPSTNDGIAEALSAQEKRSVHEVLSTLQSSSSQLSALEVGTLNNLGLNEVVLNTMPGSRTSEESNKAEAEIAKSWVHNFMKIRSLWNNKQNDAKVPRNQSQNSLRPTSAVLLEPDFLQRTEEKHVFLNAGVDERVEDTIGCVCEECSVETATDKDADSEEGGKELQHIKVVHTRESFVKYLQRLPLAEVKTVSHMAFLSNLAYVIPTIKPGDLLKNHHLRFVTSSLHKKAEEELKQKTTEENAALGKEPPKESASIEGKDLGSGPGACCPDAKQHGEEIDGEGNDAISLESAAGPCVSLTSSLQLGDGEDISSMEYELNYGASVLAAVTGARRETTTAVAVDKENKKSLSTNMQSSHSCPCEWFICDDELSKIRNFAIQGSDSVASWQANLLFEPTPFEDPNLGVMVHRGIYEAAIGLYEQVLPSVIEHLRKHGNAAQIRFTGHSLGAAGLPQNHVQMVVMHRDIVPRSFTCDYPDHVAEVLKRVNGTFRDYACLKKQKLLYAPMGVMRVLQPPPRQSPGHPFLPGGSGLYDIQLPDTNFNERDVTNWPQQSSELRSAQRAFLNTPHPLEILRDRTSYGSGGGISRDHDPRSYAKAVSYVLRQELRKLTGTKTEKRMQLWWPSLGTDIRLEFIKNLTSKSIADLENSVNVGESGSIGAASAGMGANHQVLRRSVSSITGGHSITSPRKILASGSTKDRLSRYSRLIASKHVHMGMLLIVSARVLLMQGLATFIG